MISIAELKSVAKPQDVARYFLGAPKKKIRNELWYKSPFRTEERTASFVVSDKGFHDFGTSDHYDIISFVQRLKHCSFKQAVLILKDIFGIQDTYDTRKLEKWLKEQEEFNNAYQRKMRENYLDVWDAVEQEEKINNKCLEIFSGDIENEAYKICLDKKCYLDGLKHHLVHNMDTFKSEEELYQRVRRGGFPLWLMVNLKNNTIYSTISGTT